jgi:hypothetical protein
LPPRARPGRIGAPAAADAILGPTPVRKYLPPLIVLLAFGLVAVRCALEPSRPVGREHIAGLVQGRQFEQAERRLARYLERFDDLEDHWFAARMYLRMERPADGIEAIWNHPAIAREEGTARRFAEIALFAVGWKTADRSEPTLNEPRALTVLVEGGNAWADGRLGLHAREADLSATTMYFYPAYRLATRRPMTILTPALRQRQEEYFRVAAALGALHAEDYPEKERDIDLLKRVVLSAEWRQQHLQVWAVACLALGRSGDAEAVDALLQAEAQLEGSSRARDRDDLLLLRNGLVAAGVWRVDEELAENALAPEPKQFPAVWYLEALIHRHRQGDMRSELRLTQIWEGPGTRFSDLRHRIARAFLLQDEPPSAEAVEKWVDRMLRDLEAGRGGLMSRVLAQAYRLRKGEAGAQDRILALLREAAETLQDDSRDPYDRAIPYVEALRALYLYG